VLSYRVILDVPFQLAVFVSGLLAEHRRELGTRAGTRALTCWKQAVFALAWFRDRPDIRRLGQGSGISQATAYRYKDEAVRVLAARAPSLREALDKAVEQGLPYLILDGTLVASDRCADKKTSRKGKEIDKWYSGKAHRPAGNVQALAAPGGVPLWVSDVLPGSTHDLTAARELVLPQARVIAAVVLRATARAVCLAFVEAMQEYGIPGKVLSDNGKQFTGRFGRPPPGGGAVRADLPGERHRPAADQAPVADHDGEDRAAAPDAAAGAA
jgi:DDE superfamily endonuclease